MIRDLLDTARAVWAIATSGKPPAEAITEALRHRVLRGQIDRLRAQVHQLEVRIRAADERAAAGASVDRPEDVTDYRVTDEVLADIAEALDTNDSSDTGMDMLRVEARAIVAELRRWRAGLGASMQTRAA